MVKHQKKVSTGITKAGNVFVKFYCRGKRYRFSNGRAIDREIFPNKEKCKRAKQQKLSVLKSAFEVALFDGWLPQEKEESTNQTSKVEINDILKSSYKEYLDSEISDLYKRDLKWAMNTFLKYLNTLSKKKMTIDELTPKILNEFFNLYSWSNRTKRNVRGSLNNLFGDVFEENRLDNSFKKLVFSKSKLSLNKPFKDVSIVLEDIKSFNENLFLCCLLTYGCLLRPHQEIRNLKWGDFSEDMKHIPLSGRRNKSGRNRIVPLKPYILQYLHRGKDTINIFTNEEKPFKKDYFKTLWSRYKAHSTVLEDLQTL